MYLFLVTSQTNYRRKIISLKQNARSDKNVEASLWTAVLLQPDVVFAVVDDTALNTPEAMIKGVWSALATGFVIETSCEGQIHSLHMWG